jgi:hypothetical protein
MNEPPGPDWKRCQYFSYWDVPRTVVLNHQGMTLLLDSPFEEDRDEYRPSYYVWELAPTPTESLQRVTWPEVERLKVRRLDDLPVAAVRFAPKRENDGKHFYAWYQLPPDFAGRGPT